MMIYSPIFEKNKKMELYERSTLQLMNVLCRNEEKYKINSFKYSAKTHSTLEKSIYPAICRTSSFFNKAGRLVSDPSFKLLNNSNFGIDGRNNLGNCTLEPLFDEICEISCIKNYVPFLVTKLTGIFILES